MGESESKLFLEENTHTCTCAPHTHAHIQTNILTVAKDQTRVWYWTRYRHRVCCILCQLIMNRIKLLPGPQKSLIPELVHSQMHGSLPGRDRIASAKPPILLTPALSVQSHTPFNIMLSLLTPLCSYLSSQILFWIVHFLMLAILPLFSSLLTKVRTSSLSLSIHILKNQ